MRHADAGCNVHLLCCPALLPAILPCSWETYLYVARGLFERHKPIFSLMMSLKFAVRWETGSVVQRSALL